MRGFKKVMDEEYPVYSEDEVEEIRKEVLRKYFTDREIKYIKEHPERCEKCGCLNYFHGAYGHFDGYCLLQDDCGGC